MRTPRPLSPLGYCQRAVTETGQKVDLRGAVLTRSNKPPLVYPSGPTVALFERLRGAADSVRVVPRGREASSERP